MERELFLEISLKSFSENILLNEVMFGKEIKGYFESISIEQIKKLNKKELIKILINEYKLKNDVYYNFEHLKNYIEFIWDRRLSTYKLKEKLDK